ncbi:MAG: HAMP domain-containing histidine kinase [DPANN group archaeon]|nr:HAMP domain-containing histidine kinase [DPANN group archaeon]
MAFKAFLIDERKKWSNLNIISRGIEMVTRSMDAYDTDNPLHAAGRLAEHDLRELNAPVLSNLSLMIDHASYRKDPEVRKLLKESAGNAYIMNQALAYLGDDLDPRHIPFITPEDVSLYLRGLLPEENITNNLRSPVNGLVHATAIQMIKNARKYANTPTVTVDGDYELMKYDVKDTGDGVHRSVKDLPGIFHGLSEKGTGLGLSFSRLLLEKLGGGHMEVETIAKDGQYCHYSTTRKNRKAEIDKVRHRDGSTFRSIYVRPIDIAL